MMLSPSLCHMLPHTSKEFFLNDMLPVIYAICAPNSFDVTTLPSTFMATLLYMQTPSAEDKHDILATFYEYFRVDFPSNGLRTDLGVVKFAYPHVFSHYRI